MKKDLQYEKAEAKIILLKDFITDIIEYNNITDYYNVKEYNILIDYTKDTNYHYTVKIMRGTNKPEKKFELRFESQNKINNILGILLNSLKENKYFSYTSKKKKEFSINYDEYVMNFKNNVKLSFPIKDEEDLNFYSLFEEELGKKKVILSETNIENYENLLDIIQGKKAIKIIQLVKNLLLNLYNYNNIENYDNIKPWTLKVINKYDNNKESYVYSFIIERGNINPEKMFEMNISILDTNIIYNEIYDLLKEFISKEEVGSNTITENKLSIKLNNGIELKFEFNNKKDQTFYNAFYQEHKKTNNVINTKLLIKK
ncbi:MAG: hypothetical protein IJD92_04235 [Bacilli bacterium]|nr:hypothetical protein [Bacilli bacterium]